MSQEMGSSSQKRKTEELEATKSTHNVLRISEEPKGVKEAGTEEEKKLDPKYKLMLDVALMKGRLKGLKHIAAGNDDADCELKKEIEDLTKDLKIKTEELEKLEAMKQTWMFKKCKSNDELQEARKEIQDLKAMNHSLIVKERQTNDELQETRKKLEDVEAMNQTLLVKERQSNDELQEARKELINVYISDRALIRVKRLGEIDPKPFQDACKKKYSANEADIKACQLCYDWQNKLKDPNWLPFVNVKVGENLYKTNIDENDVKLSSLRNDMGEDVFKAVANALLELKEYAGSGKFPDPELWNFKEGRRATLKEGIQRLCQLMPKK